MAEGRVRQGEAEVRNEARVRRLWQRLVGERPRGPLHPLRAQDAAVVSRKATALPFAAKRPPIPFLVKPFSADSRCSAGQEVRQAHLVPDAAELPGGRAEGLPVARQLHEQARLGAVGRPGEQSRGGPRGSPRRSFAR